MEIKRTITIESDDIQIGDQIRVNKYTATCQALTDKGALFLFDQYLDEDMPMNEENTNEGGYASSDLRKLLQSPAVLNLFADYRARMAAFDNGDLVRIPTMTEMFGKVYDWAKPTENEGRPWPLMQEVKNRVAYRNNEWEWGWLQNTYRRSATYFCSVDNDGHADDWSASNSFGVRPAFLII